MMNQRFELIVFDWDGTLIDSVHWITDCLQQAAKDCRLPVPTPRLARSVIGLSLTKAMETLFPAATEAEIQSLMQAYHRYYDAETLTQANLFEGVADLLDDLRVHGYKLAVATGKTRNGLNQALATTGYSDWFDATRTAGETASKPNPLMLMQLMEELQTTPATSLMVGDSIHDLAMAQNAGMQSIAVTSGANDREDLLPLQPLQIFDYASALRTVLL